MFVDRLMMRATASLRHDRDSDRREPSKDLMGKLVLVANAINNMLRNAGLTSSSASKGIGKLVRSPVQSTGAAPQ
jgi:hypothetical protein